MQVALLQELRSVTAADMPPEAVLQRPSVLQHVLALLQPADKGSSLPKAALQFLLCFVRRIKWALGMAADPDLLPSSTGQQERISSTCWHLPADCDSILLHVCTIDAHHGRKTKWNTSCLASWLQNLCSMWKMSSQSEMLLRAETGDVPGCCYTAAQGQPIDAMLATLIMQF